MHSINLNEINEDAIHFYFSTAEKGIEFLQIIGLLPITRICTKCSKVMDLVKSKNIMDGYIFRCGRPCRKGISLRKDSFFENSNLSLKQIFRLIYYWAYEESSIKKIKRELKIGSEAICEWKNYLREICTLTILDRPSIIGGEGVVVQMDELPFVKRKYNTGRAVEQKWIFGGIDCTTKKCFLFEVEKRDKETLIRIIKNFIREGTTIVSDLWKTYDCLSDHNYNSLRVTHKLNFVDSIPRTNTSKIENLWMRAKKRNKKERGSSRISLTSYLNEFIWRKNHENNPFSEIIKDINIYYGFS